LDGLTAPVVVAGPASGNNAAMPGLLTRYILGDFLRIFLLTLGVLITVISFGAAIKPLTDESLLDFAQAAKYIGLAMVPMMQFALPFAAGFAATLTFHRLASDNEIIAMASSGISYRRILMPIAGIGLGLTLLMVVLTQWIIPRFWGLMADTLASDFTALFESSIQNGRAFELDDVQIYADRLIIDEEPSNTDADTRLTLYGVAAAEVADDGIITTDVTASEAQVDIHRIDGRTLITLVMYDTVAYNHRSGELVSTPRIVPTRPFLVPRIIKDEPVAMPRERLLYLRENPDDFRKVVRARADVAELMRGRAAWDELNDSFVAAGVVDLKDMGPQERRFRVYARGISNGKIAPQENRGIEVEQIIDGTPVRRIVAQDARLVRGDSGALSGMSFDLVLDNCQVTDLGPTGAVNQRQQLTFFNLGLEGPQPTDLLALSSTELLSIADQLENPDASLEEAAQDLRRRLKLLRHAIAGELQYRYALSATAVIVILLGAVLAIWLREALPLSVYLLSFTPAVADLMLISGGMWMMVDGRPLGIIMMWSGNVGLVILLLLAYKRMARH
jgi:lipopolysaccharide export LptBFGC system permease protein LptF